LHELPITQGILRIALEAAERAGTGATGAGAPRIRAINLVVGDLSSIVDDAVQFYFDLLSQDTAAVGARLCFERQPATMACRDCGRSFDVRPPLPRACPHCAGERLQVTGGRELRVASIEVVDGDGN
jgi:hydrogenase nickel incorporation protein HypA/HybF